MSTLSFGRILLCASCCILAGCGKYGPKNSEFAYLHQPLEQKSAFVLPEGYDVPVYQPLMPMPEGVATYPAAPDVQLAPLTLV